MNILFMSSDNKKCFDASLSIVKLKSLLESKYHHNI